MYFDGINLREDNAEGHYFTEGIDDLEFSKLDFKLIEDEIDIQYIEEIDIGYVSNIDGMANERTKDKFNEIIRAIKQLDKNK